MKAAQQISTRTSGSDVGIPKDISHPSADGLPIDFQAFQQSLMALATANPLAALVSAAEINQAIARQAFPETKEGLPFEPWPGGFESSEPPQVDGAIFYPSIELAGEAALYEAIHADPDLETLFTSAGAWQVHGIDAIARSSTGGYVLREAKGTTLALSGTPLPYLKKARHKGRQLTRRWRRDSLIDISRPSHHGPNIPEPAGALPARQGGTPARHNSRGTTDHSRSYGLATPPREQRSTRSNPEPVSPAVSPQRSG